MDSNPLMDVVSRQYERWMYPEPIIDLPAWLQDNWQWFDPSHAHRMLWPDRDYQPGMDILVAGCGTNQAAVIAFTNPTSRVVGIDVSETSLAHHAWLAQKYQMTNLALHRLPIEEADSLAQDFDLIIATGVLHHLQDPESGMRSLAGLLRRDAVLAVMLYAAFGRLGVEMMQSVFRDLGLGEDEASLPIVREAIADLPADHPLQGYLRIAPDLQDDAGLVDTFLSARERAYTIDECRDLVAAAGLVFQDLFLMAPYYAPRTTGSSFLSSVAALPREQQWSIMERINPRNGCHFFTACRPDRPRETYVIDFALESAGDYVPSFRYFCRLERPVLHHAGGHLHLTEVQAALLSQVDGHRSIGAIVDAVRQDGSLSRITRAETTTAGLETFLMFWQLDCLAMGISSRP